eukprot:g6766.t1
MDGSIPGPYPEDEDAGHQDCRTAPCFRGVVFGEEWGPAAELGPKGRSSMVTLFSPLLDRPGQWRNAPRTPTAKAARARGKVAKTEEAVERVTVRAKEIEREGKVGKEEAEAKEVEVERGRKVEVAKVGDADAVAPHERAAKSQQSESCARLSNCMQ